MSKLRAKLGEPPVIVTVPGTPNELKDLADTFEAMLDRLQDAVDSQRRFAANASHELRTR